MTRKRTIASRIQSFIPILAWLPKYNVKENLAKDIIGGLTVGIMHIPQGMAYASLANLQPVNGLYTSFFAPLIYMFFGTSRHVSLGVFAVVSLISGSCNVRVTEELFNNNGSSYESMDREYISLRVSTSLTLLAGLIGISMAIMRLDFMLSFLSDQVIKGFTTGAAFHVFVAQLNKIMGVKLPRRSGAGKLFMMLSDLTTSARDGAVNYFTVAISIFTIIVLYSAKEYLNPAVKRKVKKLPIPYDLIVMIVGVILSSLLNLTGWLNIKVIGHIPTGIPLPSLPDVSLFPHMINDAFSVALVSMVVTISMGKLFAKKHNYSLDDRQEFYALGLCGALGSFFPIWPPSTALARTLVYEAAGTKTQLATVFSCGLLLSVMLFLGPFLESLPVCLLSCIIIVALKGMFMQMWEIPKLWKISRLDAMCFVVTTLFTVAFDVVEGLLAGVLFSFAAVLYRTQRSFATRLEEKIDGEKGPHLTVKLGNAVFYMNVDKVKRDIENLLEDSLSPRERPKCRAASKELIPLTVRKSVDIDMSSVTFIDNSGIAALLELITEQQINNIRISFVNFTDPARETIDKHPLKEKFYEY